MCDEPAHHVWIVRAVVGHLGDGAVAEIAVACQAGLAGEVLRRGPEAVVAVGVVISACEPGLVLRAGIDLRDHGAKQRWLRAREEVGAVRVEDSAVVLDFEEEIFNDALREWHASVLHQTQEDEVAVPAVHFIEAATGNDVAIGQVKQTLLGDLGYLDVAHLCDPAG